MEAFLQGIDKIHFVGIGGSGMCPLAEILHSLGYTLTGSDISESDNVVRLRGMGIPVLMPQAADNIGDAQLVVYTAAVRADNPELTAANERGIPLMERATLLGLLSRRFARTVAVAGTHGKTSTSSMLAQILLQADLDPSAFIGGRLPLINANGRAFWQSLTNRNEGFRRAVYAQGFFCGGQSAACKAFHGFPKCAAGCGNSSNYAVNN